MPRNDDMSLILAKAKLNGMLPDVKNEELDAIQQYSNFLFGDDATFAGLYGKTGTNGISLDVTTAPYNAKGDGISDDYAAINNAAASLETFGGGTLFIPKGTYKISAYLQPRNYVKYKGAGIGRTVIKPYQSAAFTGHGTLATPLQNTEFEDMTWDGSDIASNNSVKGHFSMYLKGSTWLRVECKNFTATGFGSDYIPGGKYLYCIASGNGRGQAIDGPGMSGFGIGTGQYDIEDVEITGCIAFSNTNYGIFFERQPDANAFNSKGVRVHHNICHDNGYGIGGCGLDGAVYDANIVWNNIRDGITLSAGSGASPLGMPDKRAVITANQIYGNGRDGISLDYSGNSIPSNEARHIVSGNNSHNNTRDGFRLTAGKWASDIIRGVKVTGNKFTNNGGEGVNVLAMAGAEAGVHIDDLHVEENDINGNGLNGIHLSINMTRPVVKNNNGYDDQNVKTQAYGVLTDTGFTFTDATIKDNTLLGNKTDAALFNGTWAGDTSVRGNRGYIPGWVSITVGASPFSYVCGVTPEIVYWAGGATSAVKITPKGSTQATVLLNSGAETIPLLPGDSVEFTYTSAPTSLKTIKQQ